MLKGASPQTAQVNVLTKFDWTLEPLSLPARGCPFISTGARAQLLERLAEAADPPGRSASAHSCDHLRNHHAAE